MALVASPPCAHDPIVLDATAVRSLAIARGYPVVTSLYLDVDGLERPRRSDLERALGHLVREGHAMAAALGPTVTDAVGRDLWAIQGWLSRGLDRTTTRGIAVFSASHDALFRGFELAEPVADQIVLDAAPDVAQLVAFLAGATPILVVSLDQTRARLLRIVDGDVTPRGARFDEPEHRVDTDVELGSFAHRHEERHRRHLRWVVRAIEAELEREPAEHLVLNGPPSLRAQLEDALPSEVSARVVGRLSIPTASPTHDLARAARGAAASAEIGRQRDLIASLHDLAVQHHDAVEGLDATLAALSDQRVATLLVGTGFSAGGTRCARCGALGTGRRSACGRCGATMLRVGNIVDAAVSEAFAHHVRVEFCEDMLVAPMGHIGALERHEGVRGA